MKLELTINEALRLFNINRILEGQSILDKLLLDNPHNIKAHQIIVKFAFKTKEFALAEKHLKALLNIQPTSEIYLNPLIELYRHQNRWQDLANIYSNLALNKTGDSTVLYNCAYYMKLAGKFDEAIEYYVKVLKIGINNQYEVYLNIATIYSEHLSKPDKAIDILINAIRIYPDQDSLLYNIANVYEQLGNKEKAFSFFQAALTLNPKNYDALARQADIYKVKNKNDELISKMEGILSSDTIPPSHKVNIAYALGKANDDCGEYSLAFDFYKKANTLDQNTLPQYQPKLHEEYISKIINTFNTSWFESIDAPLCTSDNNPPIFICGMFRSGSTLCEQILAGHSQISIGGEQEFFHRSISNHCANFPTGISEYLAKNKVKLLEEYLLEINPFRKNGRQLTDKRPDNFLYLGLIKTLMPQAKIIWTQRSMIDNCLSIFFLRLGASMSYATKLENTVHFYQQQKRLMRHWQTLFSNDIYEFNYDELIDQPENTIKDLLKFIDLPWENSCLQFHKVENQVKTASVWQVRQPLYKGSSGRWKNYQQCLNNLALS